MKTSIIILFIISIISCTTPPAPPLSDVYYWGAVFRLKKDTTMLVVCSGDYFKNASAIRVKSLKTGEYYLIENKELIK